MHRPRHDYCGLRPDSPGMEGARRSRSDRRSPGLCGARHAGSGRLDPGIQGRAVTASVVDFSFPHRWKAEILAARPLILPPRHFVYPREVEEIERGALEVMVRPNQRGAPGLD